MRNFLYLRLALGNLWKNRQTYAPFLLAAVMLTFTFFSFLSLTANPGLREVPGYTAFLLMLSLGLVIVGVFSAIFLFYANGFLIKRRKREMGLYSILGMEKKHIARVVRHELFLGYVLTMAIGLGLGMVLNRLLFLLIRIILQVQFPLTPSISPLALIVTPILFALLFLCLVIYNSWQVRSVSPIDLLRGSQVGEKEPKARWFFGILGVVLLAAGYWIACTVSDSISAIMLFFVAVLLVILGTYCLFMAGTLSILKLLKRNNRIFYHPQHFITLSGMLYRMKQNAAGLASIAILCTMAMVTIGTTVALYRGADQTLNQLYPSDLKLNVSSAVDMETARDTAQACAQEMGIALSNLHAFQSHEILVKRAGNELLTLPGPLASTLQSTADYSQLLDMCVLTEQTFEDLQGISLDLADGEAAFYSLSTPAPSSIVWGEAHFALRALDTLHFTPAFSYSAATNSVYFVVKDAAALQALFSAIDDQTGAILPVFLLQMDIPEAPERQDAFAAAFRSQLTVPYHSFFNKNRLRTELYSLYGGFLFVGLFLGVLFLMATALILYFKQISEGYQDHDRFIILQKVGMSPQEVRKTVATQVLIVFFLPLLVAVCHVAGSLKMVTLMLRALGLSNTPYITLNVFLAAAFVAMFYFVFYAKTTKTYYKMVRFE